MGIINITDIHKNNNYIPQHANITTMKLFYR